MILCSYISPEWYIPTSSSEHKIDWMFSGVFFSLSFLLNVRTMGVEYASLPLTDDTYIFCWVFSALFFFNVSSHILWAQWDSDQVNMIFMLREMNDTEHWIFIFIAQEINKSELVLIETKNCVNTKPSCSVPRSKKIVWTFDLHVQC